MQNEFVPSAGIVMIHNKAFPVNFHDPLNVINTGTMFYNAVCYMWIGHELFINWWDAYWLQQALCEFLTFFAIQFVAKNTRRKNVYYTVNDYILVLNKRKDWSLVEGTGMDSKQVLGRKKSSEFVKQGFDQVTYCRSMNMLFNFYQKYGERLLESISMMFVYTSPDRVFTNDTFYLIIENC